MARRVPVEPPTSRPIRPPAPPKNIAGRAFSIVLTLLVLAGLGLYAADNWMRQQVADYVTAKVVQVLGLSADQPVTVTIAGASVIAQVIGGSFDDVRVGVDNVQIGELTGGVEIQASGIPTDIETEAIDQVRVRFTISEKSLQLIGGALSAGLVRSVVLSGDEIQVGTGFKLLGAAVSVGVGIEPFAGEGLIGFTPTSVELNGTRTTADDLAATFGPLASAALKTQSICVARWLPEALTVDSVRVDDNVLVVIIGADQQIFNDASLAQLGSCA